MFNIHYFSPVIFSLYVYLLRKVKPCPDNRKIIKFRKYHNIGLSIASFLFLIGSIFSNIQSHKFDSLKSLICQPYLNTYLVYYVSKSFYYSKYWEWLDTAFLHLSGKEISFLHYSHHMSVPLLGYINIRTETVYYGFILIFTNSFVHFFMYWYYAYPKGILRPYRQWITRIQIIQHLICLLTIISTYLYDDCIQLPGCNEYSLSGYLMYLYYFLDFYWKNYRKDKIKV